MYCDEKTGQLSFTEPKIVFNKETRLWKNFLEFHTANPHIYEYYKEKIHKAVQSGRDVYSIQLITEENRWEKRYRISNNHTAYYARLFIEENPQYKSFFKLRPVKRD